MQSINSFFTNAQQQITSLYGFQDALLYQPNEPDTSRTIVQPPSLFRMPYEKIIIETDDNEKLHGFLIKQMHRANECETLVFFHGNAGNIGHRLQNASLLYQSCNINILLFDYRGYGKSTGTPSENGFYTDAQAVYDYVRKRTDLNQEKIFLFGRSLGGAVALHLASDLAQSDATPPLYAVILENTFTSIPEMGKRLFQVFILDYVPIWCYKNVFSSITKIRHINVPVLFLSGERDELVPPQMMQKLHEECQSSKKQLVLFSDGQHNTTWFSNNYASHIRHFLTECSTLSETTSTASNFN
jgi:pimeloyl-ACP methyl ester carboxylesterase